EQTRSEYATSLGIDFVEYYKAGYQFVIAGLEIEYRKPLGYKTEFYITVFTKSFDKNRMDFSQEIRRKSDDKLMATAMVHVACIDIKTRKSCMPDMLSQILEKETIAAAITDQGK
ncbi:MAG: acyl-CoA thioesterase, partial [Gammaproteobacteria bacterium]|nr:acyl-CoA thioesterase [Gammaproteobacteria bacterium]